MDKEIINSKERELNKEEKPSEATNSKIDLSKLNITPIKMKVKKYKLKFPQDGMF